MIALNSSKNVVYVQYAGDFRESLDRLARGGAENYYGQRYSVDEVLRIARQCQSTTVICCLTNEAYDEISPSGVRLIGMGLSEVSREEVKRVMRLCDEINPTEAIVRFADRRLISWLDSRGARVLPLFAQSFDQEGLRNRVRHRLLSTVLDSSSIQFVANHQMNAALSLARIGVAREKILPYDWAHGVTPADFAVKKFPNRKEWRIVYCGALVATKGVEDALRAIALVRSNKYQVSLTLIGRGELDRFLDLAQSLGIDESCDFKGLVSHDEVIGEMHRADIALVPSHHAYPEAFPMTICESLIVRTPVVVSDHPMFRGKIIDGKSGLVARERCPEAIAQSILAYMNDAGLYESISKESAAAWESLQVPLRWGELIERWIRGDEADVEFLRSHSLATVQHEATEVGPTAI